MAAAAALHQIPDWYESYYAFPGLLLHVLLAAGIDTGFFWVLLDRRPHDIAGNSAYPHELFNIIRLSVIRIQTLEPKGKKKHAGFHIIHNCLSDDNVSCFCMGIPSGIPEAEEKLEIAGFPGLLQNHILQQLHIFLQVCTK